jgi:hypothetical protein
MDVRTSTVRACVRQYTRFQVQPVRGCTFYTCLWTQLLLEDVGNRDLRGILGPKKEEVGAVIVQWYSAGLRVG